MSALADIKFFISRGKNTPFIMCHNYLIIRSSQVKNNYVHLFSGSIHMET